MKTYPEPDDGLWLHALLLGIGYRVVLGVEDKPAHVEAGSRTRGHS